MLPFRHFTQLGNAVERIGRAAAPGSLPATSPRPSDVAPAPFRSDYAGTVSGLDLLRARSIDESMIDNGRSCEYQREAPTLGAAIGSAIGLGIAAWFGRGGRR